VIAQFLEDNFMHIMNVGFTAEMEDKLELVADNKKEWKRVIKDFWEQFIPTIDIAEKEAFVPKLMTEIDCPKCKEAKLQKIWSKSRYFYGCSRYPDCDFTASNEELNFNRSDYASDFDWDQKCPNCGSPMKLRHGRFGPFLGCTTYPTCKGIVNITKIGESAVSSESASPCPAIDCNGKIIARKSRFGKIFYSCTNFPDCDVIVNDLDQLIEKYSNHPKTPYQKKTSKGGKRGGGGKGKGKLKPSDALAAVIGNDPVSRGEATKKIWDYIKANNLQDVNDKRQIVPDALLTKVFGSSQPINMFKLASILGQNLS
jgi:DNA topoisomerase-1